MCDSDRDPASARTGGGQPARPQLGLYMLRVERQQDYLLITVTSTLRVEPGPLLTGDENPEYFTDPAEALRSTAHFLAAFR